MTFLGGISEIIMKFFQLAAQLKKFTYHGRLKFSAPNGNFTKSFFAQPVNDDQMRPKMLQ
jgi:hypothetical protein